MSKKIIFVLIGVAILLFFGYRYVYHQHRDIENEEAEHIVTADVLQKAFLETPDKAKSLYLNKTLIVKGNITELNPSNLTVDHTVFCDFKMIPKGTHLQETVKIKGRCIGFDDLLGQVKLDQCSVLK